MHTKAKYYLFQIYLCLFIASTLNEWPRHLNNEWTIRGTSSGWLFSHFGLAGMSCGSGSPWAVQLQAILSKRLVKDILLLYVCCGPTDPSNHLENFWDWAMLEGCFPITNYHYHQNYFCCLAWKANSNKCVQSLNLKLSRKIKGV